MRYIKTGWYSGVREGRFLITRRVDQPFSLVLALPLFPLSSIHSFSIYFLFPLCLSCIVSASTVSFRPLFVYLYATFVAETSFLFVSLYTVSVVEVTFLPSLSLFAWSLSLKSWTVYTSLCLSSRRSSYSICFISLSHLAIGIRPLAQGRPTPLFLHLSPAINLLRSSHPFSFLTLCAARFVIWERNRITPL